MIIPGLGGRKFYEEHIEETAKVLGSIRPKFITFMGINPAPKSRYTLKMNEEQLSGENRPLSDLELFTQMIEIINEMPFFETKIGCFNDKIDKVGYNPYELRSVDFNNRTDKRNFIRECKE